MLNLDLTIFEYIHRFAGQNYYLDFTSHALAKFLPFGIIFLLILLTIKDKVKYGPISFQAVLAGIFTKIFIVTPFEIFMPRERPFVVLGFDPLVPKEASPAFPSSHATFFFALSTVIFFKNQRLGIFLYICSILISLSRVHTGLHWPLDVLAGAMLGIATGLIFQKIKEKRSR